jgi:hypothetical protein
MQRLRDVAEKALTDDAFDAVMAAMIRRAAKGNVQAATFLRDTLMGKPHQSISLEGGATPVKLEYVVDDTPAVSPDAPLEAPPPKEMPDASTE